MKILIEAVKGSDNIDKKAFFVKCNSVKFLIEPVKGSERRRAEPEDKSDFILIWKRKYVKSDFLLLKEVFEAHPDLKKESFLNDIPLKRKCFLIELYLQYTRGTPFWYEKESLYILHSLERNIQSLSWSRIL